MFNFDVLTTDKDFTIQKNDTKEIYNLDHGFTASSWVREEVKKIKKKIDTPKVSSALSVKQKGYSKLCEGAIGYFYNNGNNVYYNQTNVSLFTTAFSGKSGLSIIEGNIKKVFTLFAARKLILSNWLNQKDEYSIPNLNHHLYDEYEKDSIIYSLFNNSSNQSSLRQVEYRGELWDIKNEFFWLSVDEMKGLSDKHNYDELYQDAHADDNRYVHTLLFGEENIYDQLSDEAKTVLDYATELTKDSIEMRKHIANDENHLNSWDAGYAQLKLVWKELYPERFKEFRQLYKNLEEKMRPMVYELGFLKK